jgi:hypothetical protein
VRPPPKETANKAANIKFLNIVALPRLKISRSSSCPPLNKLGQFIRRAVPRETGIRALSGEPLASSRSCADHIRADARTSRRQLGEKSVSRRSPHSRHSR